MRRTALPSEPQPEAWHHWHLSSPDALFQPNRWASASPHRLPSGRCPGQLAPHGIPHGGAGRVRRLHSYAVGSQLISAGTTPALERAGFDERDPRSPHQYPRPSPGAQPPNYVSTTGAIITPAPRAGLRPSPTCILIVFARSEVAPLKGWATTVGTTASPGRRTPFSAERAPRREHPSPISACLAVHSWR